MLTKLQLLFILEIEKAGFQNSVENSMCLKANQNPKLLRGSINCLKIEVEVLILQNQSPKKE